jgi:hypothetical protein
VGTGTSLLQHHAPPRELRRDLGDRLFGEGGGGVFIGLCNRAVNVGGGNMANGNRPGVSSIQPKISLSLQAGKCKSWERHATSFCSCPYSVRTTCHQLTLLIRESGLSLKRPHLASVVGLAWGAAPALSPTPSIGPGTAFPCRAVPCPIAREPRCAGGSLISLTGRSGHAGVPPLKF